MENQFREAKAIAFANRQLRKTRERLESSAQSTNGALTVHTKRKCNVDSSSLERSKGSKRIKVNTECSDSGESGTERKLSNKICRASIARNVSKLLRKWRLRNTGRGTKDFEQKNLPHQYLLRRVASRTSIGRYYSTTNRMQPSTVESPARETPGSIQLAKNLPTAKLSSLSLHDIGRLERDQHGY